MAYVVDKNMVRMISTKFKMVLVWGKEREKCMRKEYIGDFKYISHVLSFAILKIVAYLLECQKELKNQEYPSVRE